ncbi:MAG: 16S rRNA (guanine(966)-N(2))-methyltransferase RsmD [Nitrospinota bacterium]|jgi:16S rRNA (guanine966-N2)-methyltransferase|nr:16S rRNA (guanine(966)-N(2))-methyltransferase RsmD [Nitrospinota bacterium]MDP7167149.1 16S rRNA (guanine(966)-N(2))-methyltransferase RsmD [Nitrospinota bacterium]MDP7369945.1 16S rRNA (guanine(966)-N(2))-methyltransferase RsmD [Nitrospinota bacterium]MDP7503695.1 16S rRNA (guanine(966)-N(2))-methyltransferase RsmD [Nitrospinota bacterium]MDP7664621.1 16S rRNA (guanine(966)-N(2))-methyltransferase RsmD [Nitrospinota bacterium]
MALRIIGGVARGRRLASPPGEGVRPTSDRVREALFNIWRQRLDGWRLLDVCAGSGAVSLEALSREAARAVAIEMDAARCSHILEEAGRLDLAEGLEVCCGEALTELSRLRREGGVDGPEGPPFDAAFVDPPWAEGELRRKILSRLFEAEPLCRVAVAEIRGGDDLPEAPGGARVARRANYGGTSLIFFEAEVKDPIVEKRVWT